MTKLKKTLILIFALSALCALSMAFSACTNTSLAKKLDMPINVSLEISHRKSGTEYFLYWDAVEGAEKYSITVDGKTAEAKTAPLNATELMTEGAYSRVYIKAIGNGVTTRDSDENKPVLFAEKVSDVLVFQLSDDEKYYSVSSYAMDKEQLAGKIVMPDYYNGLPVEEISENGFFVNDGGVVNPSTGVGCNNVTTSFRLPKYLKKINKLAFAYCTTIKDVKLPDTVTEIGVGGFYSCTRLQSINLQKVTSVGRLAFYNCQSLTTVELSTDLDYFGKDVFKDTPIVTNAVGTELVIGNLLYSVNDKEVTEYTVPETVTKFASAAFYGCSKLKTLNYTNDAYLLGEGVFYGCSALESVKIPEGTKKLYNSSFYKCSALTEITIPDSVTEIDDYAFASCSGIETLTIPNGLTTIGNYAFENCSKLTEINLPDTLETIGLFCFLQDKNLSSVKLPSNLTKIESGVFLDCEALKSVVIPDSVTEIGYAAFGQCYALEYMVLPKSLKKLNLSFIAFSNNCKSLYYNCSFEDFNAIEKDNTDPDGAELASTVTAAYHSAKHYVYSETANDSYLSWRYVDGVPTPW